MSLTSKDKHFYTKNGPEKVIIDCDAGIDDALALILLISAHKHKRIEILAITCVNGNTHVDHVVQNVFRILKVCNEEDIPVYKGADSALLSTENSRIARDEKFHGSDGLGDVFMDQPDISKLKKEHAVFALQELTSKYNGKVTLLCLAPLTNIALSIKLYPEFLDSVHKLIIMGGNLSAIGNITAQAEFNFFADPESVHIVMSSMTDKKMWILPWETCLKSEISIDWRNNVFGKIDSPAMNFYNLIDEAIRKYRPEKKNYAPCDALAAAVLLRQDAAKNVIKQHVDIELNGTRTRGQVVIDHKLSNEPNSHIIYDLDFKIIKDLLIFAVNSAEKNCEIMYT